MQQDGIKKRGTAETTLFIVFITVAVKTRSHARPSASAQRALLASLEGKLLFCCEWFVR